MFHWAFVCLVVAVPSTVAIQQELFDTTFLHRDQDCAHKGMECDYESIQLTHILYSPL